EHPDWRGVLAADTFAKRIVVQRPSVIGQLRGEEWSENSGTALALWLLEAARVRVRSLDIVDQAVRHVAALQPMHPVLDYFGALSWDERARVDTFASTYLGAADTPYHRRV